MQGPRYLSPDSRRLSLVVIWGGLSVLAGLSGCRTTHAVTADRTGRVSYDKLTIVYDLLGPVVPTASKYTPLSLEDSRSRPLRAVLASRRAAQRDSEQLPELRLTIQCPAADGDHASGEATLFAPGDSEGHWQAVAQQRLSRDEIDLLFVHLVNGGVCEGEQHLHGGTRIAVEIDGHSIRKSWTREPRLDRLAVETYDAGGDHAPHRTSPAVIQKPGC